MEDFNGMSLALEELQSHITVNGEIDTATSHLKWHIGTMAHMWFLEHYGLISTGTPIKFLGLPYCVKSNINPWTIKLTDEN
jgi:hypothetical protein